MLTTTHTCILLLVFVSVVFIFMLVLVLVQAKFCKFFSFGEWRSEKNAHTHTLAQQQPTVTATNHKEREWKRIGQKEPKWKITKTLFQVTILAKMAAMEAETKLT